MRETAVRAFTAAVAAVNPRECLRRSLRATPCSLFVEGREDKGISMGEGTPLYLIAFGKAAAAMTHAAEGIVGARLKEGIAIVPKIEEEESASLLSPLPPLKSVLYEAGQANLPDRRSIEATKEVLRMVECAEEDAVFLVLISGGGSALLSLPSKGITLDHKLSTIRTLVSKGAPIQQLNAVRRALSRVKGGGLLEAFKGRQSLSLILSDIVGDPLEFIASGPTVTPESSLLAATVLKELGCRASLPKEVIDAIDREKRSPALAHAATHHHHNHEIIGNNTIALEAARRELEQEGFESTIRTCTRVGKAEDLGREIAETVIGMKRGGEKRAVLIGGETTVNVADGGGVGGRNQHAALAAMICLWERREEWTEEGLRFSLLVAGTDGQDGPTDAAGVTVEGGEIADLSEEEVERAREALTSTDSYHFWSHFRDGSAHFKPGLTGTNVMDIAIIVSE